MKYLNSKFSVGGAGSPEYASNFEATFGKRRAPNACKACDGEGRITVADGRTHECSTCAGTGRTP